MTRSHVVQTYQCWGQVGRDPARAFVIRSHARTGQHKIRVEIPEYELTQAEAGMFGDQIRQMLHDAAMKAAILNQPGVPT